MPWPTAREVFDKPIVEDVRIWYAREDAPPRGDLRTMLEDYGCRGKRIGNECRFPRHAVTGGTALRAPRAAGTRLRACA